MKNEDKEKQSNNKNYLGSFIIIATLVISASQVWIAFIAKDREIEVKKIEMDRRWDFDIAKFVIENKNLIFSPKKEEQILSRNILAIIYPEEKTKILFWKLEYAVPEKEKDVWREGQKIIQSAKSEPVNPFKFVLNELKTEGLLDKLRNAQNYIAGGAINGNEQALKIYHEVINQLSPDAKKNLDQDIWDNAKNNEKGGYKDLAARAYRQLFAKYLQE